MRFRLPLFLLLSSVYAIPQSLNYTPTPYAAYLTADGVNFSPWTSGAAFGALNYAPTPIGLYCQSTLGAAWTPCLPNTGNATAGVTSFNSRTGAVTPQASDYSSYFTTPAQAAAAAPVQSVNGSAGAVSVTPANIGADVAGAASTAQANAIAASQPAQSSTFYCSQYANLTACLNAAKAYVTSNEAGAGLAAQIFLAQGTYTLSGTYAWANGMQISGVLPRVEVQSGNMPDLNIILNGGTVINCGGAANCFTGSNLRGIQFSSLAFTNYTGQALSFGGNNIEGVAFGRFFDLYAIGSTTIAGTAGAFSFFNVQDVQFDRIFAYNVNTCFTIANQSSTGNYGNFSGNDDYCRAYPKSVANGNSTIPSVLIESLIPSSGTAGTLNNVALRRLHAQDSSNGADGTATVVSILGSSSAAQVTGLVIDAADVEGSDKYGIYINGYVTTSKIEWATRAGNTYDLGYAANTSNNDFYSTDNVILAPLPTSYTFNRFWGLFNALPTLNGSVMFGAFQTFQDSIFHVNAGNLPISGFGTNNISMGLSALPTSNTGYANVALGASVLGNSTTAYNNMGVGTYALQNCTSCHDNVSVGVSTQTGANYSGNGNTSIGTSALGSVTSNVNTAIGEYAGLGVTTGSNNTIIGANADTTTTTGSNNTVLGAGANVTSAADSNEIVIGQGVTGAGTNTTTLGNASTTQFWNYGIRLSKVLYSAAGTALPTCAAAIKGATTVVSDAASPTYMGAYTSGGAVTAAVICSYNGTTYSWLTH